MAAVPILRPRVHAWPFAATHANMHAWPFTATHAAMHAWPFAAMHAAQCEHGRYEPRGVRRTSPCPPLSVLGPAIAGRGRHASGCAACCTLTAQHAAPWLRSTLRLGCASRCALAAQHATAQTAGLRSKQRRRLQAPSAPAGGILARKWRGAAFWQAKWRATCRVLPPVTIPARGRVLDSPPSRSPRPLYDL
jgi:hypothetical protein